MRYLSILFCFLTIHSFAQDCNCSTQFEFVKKYYEENNPAFQTIRSDRKLLKAYTDSVAQISRRVAKEQRNDLCNIYFIQYVNLLKDHHSGIELNLQRVADFSSQQGIDSFKLSAKYHSFEIKKIDTAQVIARLKNAPRNKIEGLYKLGDKIRIAILENGKDHYEGIVLRSTELLEVGHVLLTFDKEEDNTYGCMYHLGLLGFNFNTAYSNHIRLVDGNLPKLGYYRNGTVPVRDQWEFKLLDSNTCYLAIRSFASELKPQLDSLYQAVIPQIQKHKYLVLDLCDNVGGDESSYFDLLPLICTKPLKLDQMSVWITEDNIKAFEARRPADDKLIARMRNAPVNSFLSLNTGIRENWTIQGTASPEKVAILFNRSTASAGEGLIVYAMQSTKVITLGEHSGGYVGYGDIRTKEIPCGEFTLITTTTKWRDKSKYELSGIPPMRALKKDTDWVKAAVEALEGH